MDNVQTFHEFCTNVEQIPGYNALSMDNQGYLKIRWEQYKKMFGIDQDPTDNNVVTIASDVTDKPKFTVGERTYIKYGKHRGLSGVVKELYEDYLILGLGTIGANVRVELC
jgi:hypothetical protein